MPSYTDYLKQQQGASPYLSLGDYGAGQMPQMFSGGSDWSSGLSTDLVSPMSNGGSFIAGQGSWMDTLQGYGSAFKDLMPKGFLDSTENGIKTQGYGMPLIAGAKGLFDAFNAYGTNKLAKQSFNLQKDIALANLDGSKKSYNTNLANKAQDASSGYQNVDDYVNKNRVA